jgi:hypothetical protein
MRSLPSPCIGKPRRRETARTGGLAIRHRHVGIPDGAAGLIRGTVERMSIEAQADDLATPHDVEVNWQALRKLVGSAGALTVQGRTTALWAFDVLEELLGRGWAGRTRRATGWLPGEMTLAAFHRAALPQLLAIATRLDRFREVPGFAAMLRELRRNPSSARWRHTLLQLEVARAAAAVGATCGLEPPVDEDGRLADVVVHTSDGSFLVETTTVFLDDQSRRSHDYERQLGNYLRSIEVRHGISTLTRLDAHLPADETQAWLADVEAAAGLIRAQGEPIEVTSAAGVIVVTRQPPSAGTPVFTGVALTQDGLRRFVRTLRGKARQSAGAQPAWLRVDVVDGLWQLTDWAYRPLAAKLDLLSQQIATALNDYGHLLGIAVSSGPLVDRHGAVGESAGRLGGRAALRRILSSGQVREILFVPLRPDAARSAELLTEAYNAEPEWLDVDLADRGLATLSELWNAG